MHDGLLDPLLALARRAADEIMAVYGTEFAVDVKADDSPLTEADARAHRVLVEGLTELTPDLPVLSEESAAVPWAERQRWRTYWLVDPLDGTKEFVKRNGEFTVNLALVENGRPIVGVVHVPATGVVYCGAEGVGAFKRVGPGPLREERAMEFLRANWLWILLGLGVVWVLFFRRGGMGCGMSEHGSRGSHDGHGAAESPEREAETAAPRGRRGCC